ncbi:AAA family ATPase [Numidum massiliense]|uniref:AAA family ATPase n=1 Tax=Numidum massiliense TaxID=1522315 RepID=UPI0006D52B90|nr:MoxR family ATPase [Numidum massiliense]
MHRAASEGFDKRHETIAKITDNVTKVIVGKEEVIRMSVAAVLCGGHVLLEDVPGVGKTMLVKALAKSLGCDFTRIQFTPDLLPSDVTGVSVFNQQTLQFEFRPGPIVGNVVLADEINRTSPKTQAALLEAMEEGSVTVDGVTRQLPQPFFVMATQNPIEYEGTFPLPEAQLDRFLMKLHLGYPSERDEVEMLERQQTTHPLAALKPVVSKEELCQLQARVRDVHVDASVSTYIVQLSEATRQHPHVYLGVSPRGSLALFRTAQAFAFMRGRSYVVPDDVKQLVLATFSHRLILKPDARLKDIAVEKVLLDVLQHTPVPVYRNK